MKINTKKRKMTGLFTLLSFALFAICMMLVLLTGASVYRRLTARDTQAFDRRTLTRYLSTKVRQAENGTDISVEPFGAEQALCIAQTLDGTPCCTRIYCYEGQLCELFTAAEDALSPEDGTALMPLSALSPTLADGMLTLDLTEQDGSTQTLSLSLRGAAREGGL